MAVLSHCLLSIFIYTHKPGLLSTVLREISFCSGQHSVERCISKQCAEDKRMSAQALIKWDGYAHGTTTKRGGCEKDCDSQKMVRNAMKWYLLNMIWLSQSWIHIHTQGQVYQNRNIDGEVDLQTYPQTNDLLTVGSCVGGEIIFYWECGHWWVSHIGDWLHIHTQKEDLVGY